MRASKMWVVGVAALLAMGLVGGCTGADGSSGDAESDDGFSAVVAQADEALETGDAQAAYDLYTDALAMGDADDPDGEIAARQEYAKHVYISRKILKDAETDSEKFQLYIEVIVNHSAAETETAEAYVRIVDYLQQTHDDFIFDIDNVRPTIEAGESFKAPFSAYMVTDRVDWIRAAERLPDPFGGEVIRALDLLDSAGVQAFRCVEPVYIDECVAELDRTLDLLAEVQTQIDLMRDSLE